MPVNQEQIRITIVVIIKEFQAPAAQHLSRRRDLTRLIREDQIFLVVVKTEKLVIDVGDEEVLPSISVIVRRINAHSGAWSTGVAVSNPCSQSYLLKLSLTFIEEEEIRHGVVRNEQIHQRVVVYIS